MFTIFLFLLYDVCNINTYTRRCAIYNFMYLLTLAQLVFCHLYFVDSWEIVNKDEKDLLCSVFDDHGSICTGGLSFKFLYL